MSILGAAVEVSRRQPAAAAAVVVMMISGWGCTLHKMEPKIQFMSMLVGWVLVASFWWFVIKS
uniref:Uncharacterized protein n=1 Tax=Oryza punctata TaxID=4537 RepID=A0A0E0JFC4_ORYPU